MGFRFAGVQGLVVSGQVGTVVHPFHWLSERSWIPY